MLTGRVCEGEGFVRPPAASLLAPRTRGGPLEAPIRDPSLGGCHGSLCCFSPIRRISRRALHSPLRRAAERTSRGARPVDAGRELGRRRLRQLRRAHDPDGRRRIALPQPPALVPRSRRRRPEGRRVGLESRQRELRELPRRELHGAQPDRSGGGHLLFRACGPFRRTDRAAGRDPAAQRQLR